MLNINFFEQFAIFENPFFNFISSLLQLQLLECCPVPRVRVHLFHVALVQKNLLVGSQLLVGGQTVADDAGEVSECHQNPVRRRSGTQDIPAGGTGARQSPGCSIGAARH